jgi:MFS family permease
VVSDIGTFMQNVGAAWLMVSFGVGPMYVALTQTASSLPFFVVALPAGSAGDIFDRRKLILSTEIWMVAAALAIALLTLFRSMSPWLLLALTFALSAGDAFESPTWRAILPEVVGTEDLAPASALNAIEFNFARAVGPALAGFVIVVAGVATAFMVNVVSFAGVILVIWRWKRPTRKRTAPPEKMTGAVVAALRYIRYSPAIRAVMLRQGVTMFFASALLALLPTVARHVSARATDYGMLLGSFGMGAVVGALIMKPARSRWSLETVVLTAVTIVGGSMIATGSLDRLSALALVMLVTGAAWITFVSLIGAVIQTLAPDWVRARVLAVFLLVFQGSVAAGSAFWGAVAQRVGLRSALVWAGVGLIASILLALGFKLPQATTDLTPWPHWRFPAVPRELELDPDQGPVLVTVEYLVTTERKDEFLTLIHQYSRIRRRDGASRWGIFSDPESDGRYTEVFQVQSWAEHLRQHQRQTQADQELENRLRACALGEPKVQHLLYARP